MTDRISTRRRHRALLCLIFSLSPCTAFAKDKPALQPVQMPYSFHDDRGSEWDVLRRFAGAAAAARADVVVRMTADCPLWAPELAVQLVQQFLETDRSGIVTNDTSHSGWPDGLDVEVFGAPILQAAAAQARRREDREHVTPWIRRRAQHWIIGGAEDWRCPMFGLDRCELAHHATATPQVGPLRSPAMARRCSKLSIDTLEDFFRVDRIVSAIPDGDYSWTATRAALLRQQEMP